MSEEHYRLLRGLNRQRVSVPKLAHGEDFAATETVEGRANAADPVPCTAQAASEKEPTSSLRSEDPAAPSEEW
jgi:hypothetical protein